MTGILHSDSTSMNLMKNTPNLAIAFEKERSEKFVATRIVDIVENMMGSGFLTGMNLQSYYRDVRVAKIMLRR